MSSGAGDGPTRMDATCRVYESGTRLTADFSAPTAGPPPWALYRLRPTTATALRVTEPGGATRWRF